MIHAPEVDFYGDTARWPVSELVHAERLVERSALHDWSIRPHRHNDLVQLFLLLRGRGRAVLDSQRHDLAAPCLLIIPERCIHEFSWSESSEGFVLSIRSGYVGTLVQRFESLGGIFEDAASVDVADSLPFLEDLFAELCVEANGHRQLRDVALDSLISVLAVWLARHFSPQPGTTKASSRAGQHFAKFGRLLHEHHKEQWSVDDYAVALGITPSHLNSICHRLAGKSTLEIIHERLVLAARRELAYTERNIAGIAHNLGFADPSYFSKFFKRRTGLTPGQYRRRSGTHAAHG